MVDRNKQVTKAVLSGGTADDQSQRFSMRQGLKNLGIQISYIEQTVSANSVVDECISISGNTFSDVGHGYETGLVGQITESIGSAACMIAAGCEVNICTETFTHPCHGLTTGESGQFTTTVTLPGGICACVNYYVISTGTNTFQVASSRANALACPAVPVDICSTGSGCHTFTPNGTIPTGIDGCACMAFIIKVDDDTYQVSSTRGGPAQDITALNAPAAVVFTPTATSATPANNGTISFTGSVDGVNFITLGCCLPANVDLAQGTCSVTSTITIDTDVIINEVQVDSTVALGQWTVDVDIVAKS